MITPNSATVRSRQTPEQAIAAIERDLMRRALAFEAVRDPRCVFAHAYACLSRELARSIEHAGFDDAEWIARLGQVFAGYYVRALEGYEARTLAPGAWATVFHAAEHGRTSVIEDLVLGMTAHIVNDLPQALCDVGLTASNGASRIGDYHRLNDVLGKAVEPIQDELSKRYDPWLHVLDQLFEHYDEILTNYGLRISRAAAWYNAERLLDPASRADALNAIAHSPEVTQQEVLDPPQLSLRFVVRIARVFARSMRRWPAATPPRRVHRRQQPCPPTSTSATSTSASTSPEATTSAARLPTR